MEESAQRKERLKAMRLEASQEGPTYNEGGDHLAVSLSNPLLEPTANPIGEVQPSAQSFNYYTNPMAAYTGNNKQKTKVSPQISHDYSSIPPSPQTNDMNPSPSFQPHISHSPIPRMQTPHGQYQYPNFSYTPNSPQVQGGYPNPGGYRGPHFPKGPPAYGPGPGNYPRPGPGYPQPGPSPGRGYVYRGPEPHFRPNPNHGPGSGPRYPTPTSGYPTPNQGRGQWLGNSRGRGGRWSGQGQGGGRGAHNYNNNMTAEDRPDLFYNKSMVEDPWKFLEPVIWKSQKKPKPWTLYSSNTKKPRVSEQKPTGSQPSLAEILAASFNEAASGEPDAAL